MGLILRSGSSLGGGHDNPLQYSCLENPMVRRAWQVHTAAKSRTWLKQLSTHSMSILELTFVMILTKYSMRCPYTLFTYKKTWKGNTHSLTSVSTQWYFYAWITLVSSKRTRNHSAFSIRCYHLKPFLRRRERCIYIYIYIYNLFWHYLE